MVDEKLARIGLAAVMCAAMAVAGCGRSSHVMGLRPLTPREAAKLAKSFKGCNANRVSISRVETVGSETREDTVCVERQHAVEQTERRFPCPSGPSLVVDLARRRFRCTPRIGR